MKSGFLSTHQWENQNVGQTDRASYKKGIRATVNYDIIEEKSGRG
jgi:hypothetical protein